MDGATVTAHRYTRGDLIAICERAIVPLEKWQDRDTPESQRKVGECWAYLRAGCEFHVTYEPEYRGDSCVTNDETIWLEVDHPNFGTFEWGGNGDTQRYYLPTPARLEQHAGEDWY